MINSNYTDKITYVIFGPANVGKSTIVGYIKTYQFSNEMFQKSISNIKHKIGSQYRADRLFSYFVDDAKDEYIKNSVVSTGDTKGTSKYTHITTIDDFYLVDTPGGNDYEVQRFKGISLANIGIFAIEIKQLLKFESEMDDNDQKVELQSIRMFFSSWYVWKKLHGTDDIIILLTKCDAFPEEEDFFHAKETLERIIGNCNGIEIIPTSILVNSEDRSDVNIFKKWDCNWYSGKTLIEELEQKRRNFVRKDDSNQLVMFYIRKYNNVPGIGTVIKWKIFSGSIRINERIHISPIKIGDSFYSLEASIKSMHDEENNSITSANAGDIVNTALSNFLYYNDRLKKENIEYLNTLIIVGKENKISIGKILEIEIFTRQCTTIELTILNNMIENNFVRILWFGRILKALVISLDRKLKDNLILTLEFSTCLSLPMINDDLKILMQNIPNNDYETIGNFECHIRDVRGNI